MIDVNLDAVHDIVFSASNTVYAIDGTTFTTIWNTSLYDFVPNAYQITATRYRFASFDGVRRCKRKFIYNCDFVISLSIFSSVTPAYFNDDRIPDLLVTFSVGATYPEYYYSVV